jgi:hypothetical protein
MTRVVEYQTKTYRHGNLCFVLTPERVVIETALQSFFLEPSRHYWRKRVSMIRLMIEMDKIENLAHLAEFCVDANGTKVIDWVVTYRKYEK